MADAEIGVFGGSGLRSLLDSVEEREVGVRRIVGPCASGSLRPDLPLGEFVVCDQFVDRALHGARV